MKNSNNNNNNNNNNKPSANTDVKNSYKIVDFAVPADHRIKLKESEKKDKYLNLARELKKLWKMKVAIIPIGIGVFYIVTKGILKGLENGHNTEKSPGNLRRLLTIILPIILTIILPIS